MGGFLQNLVKVEVDLIHNRYYRSIQLKAG